MCHFKTTLAFLALTLLPTAVHAGDPGHELACCVDPNEDPLGCMVFPDPNDMTWCDVAAEIGACSLDENEFPVECDPVDLLCCDDLDVLDDVTWIDACVPFGPAEFCDGTVVADRLTITCCQCSQGTETCLETKANECPVGWTYGHQECAP
jgi:hypothetical protein